ncbi:MAG: phage terminase large subunit family protein [Solidesulfovibrio sp. DCME]|uniref:phage terminase large subunit family protein n=1 Tax=Solidesulfovibrio sp. DCME TaxID=3447380 RepID=UPI003D096C01
MKGLGPGSRTIMADFLTKVQSVVPVRQEPPPGGVGAWAIKERIRLDRGEFSFARHECLELPYADDHPQRVDLKCAQMGNTTNAILGTLFAAIFLPIVGALYLFPSKKGSTDFVQSRVDPLIDRNPATLGRWVVETDSVGLKRVNGVNVLFRGTRTEEGLRSDPVDKIVYDEFDLMAVWVEPTAHERLGHSDLKAEHFLSNPTLPDFGVDKKYQLSDQRRWLLKCPRCGDWTDPVGEWEDAARPLERGVPDLLWERSDGAVVLRCMRCREGVLDPARGEWVARKPGVTAWRGYQFSQLFSQYVTPAEILHLYRTTSRMDKLYNYKLGLAYVAANSRITKEQVLKLCGSHGIAASDPGPCYMGVDQGKGLHVTIGRRDGVIVHVGEYRDFEELDELMNAFHVARCVIDGMPETREARKFAKRFPGRVYLNWYNEHQKGDYAWDDKDLKVSVNRTESLDASHEALSGGHVVLPARCEPVEAFANHAQNTAKKLEEDEESGSRIYVWVRLGPDHYRHSLNYYCIAAWGSPAKYFDDADLS